MNSIHKVYSLLLRLDHLNKFNLFDEFNVDDIKKDITFFSMSSKNCGKTFINNQCKRIYNEIENFRYNYDQIIFAILNELLINHNIQYELINLDLINKHINNYSKDKYNVDFDYINNIIKEIEFKNINQLFIINECGEPYIYKLIINELISPAFYIINKERILTENKTNIYLFDKSDAFERFDKIANLINKQYQIKDLIKPE
jgi:hypothetical protein